MLYQLLGNLKGSKYLDWCLQNKSKTCVYVYYWFSKKYCVAIKRLIAELKVHNFQTKTYIQTKTTTFFNVKIVS